MNTKHTLTLSAGREASPRHCSFTVLSDGAVEVTEWISYVHPSTGTRKTFGVETFRMSTAKARARWKSMLALGFTKSA